MLKAVPVAAIASLVLATPLLAQASKAAVSAPISHISYDVTFDATTAKQKSLKVSMQFSVIGPGDVLLSLPAWTPGAYEVTNFARWVSNFTPTAEGKPLGWDKLDYDTWRIHAAGAKAMTVAFDFQADTLDNAMAWSRPDFALFNGTNVFMYPEGRSLSFPATVQLHTEPDWLVATGMHRGAEAGSYAREEFPRSGGHAVLRGQVRVRQQRGERQDGPARDLSGRVSLRRGARQRMERHQADDSRRRRGVPGDAVGQLHHDDDLLARFPRADRRWSIRIRTSGSTPRS